ncbi:MAG: NADH:ubiquinone reductase (Na(+)-transporting) subunit D [Candidatus Cloacimonas sp. 4484_143]|nr:MAG: NADH:ubiquinone reductase (Na(+)-transporting) subunit D [Candidatus Cloacimonas sp. 4484_143]RLC53181.1 MAG: NADH:ubiquinone reductase (Na(+)-transporting) subunit D [Candidatus Cloacimonadota bacterium]RLC53752.1 MAG: NADH:ubiquinone reductase (Na(+)-transporting) subunit D [Candidatus Cloacimonadota bacterium]
MSNKKTFFEPFVHNNPVTVQILGICSTLAVTTQLKPSLVMGIAVTVIIVFSNLIISLIRNMIPKKIRIIVEMIIIATMVILVDQILRAYLFDVSKQLSVFVGLIITNCIVLGRLEGFALINKAVPSILDGLGNGIGYSLILVAVGAFREIFGSGTLLGFSVIPQSLYNAGYENNGLLVLAPGAFFLLGLIVWFQRAITKQYEEE